MSNRWDDYINNVTQLGTSKDKSNYTFFGASPDLTASQLDAMYEKESLGARIINRVVDDATRVGFTLKDVDVEFDWPSVKSQLDDLDAINQLGDGWRWARLYGGNITVINVDDAEAIAKPMDIEKAKRIRSLENVESRYAQPDFFDKSLGNRSFRNPRTYDVTAPLGRSGKVHGSRVIRIDGVKIPPTRLLDRGGWGPSVLDRVWRDLRRLGVTMGYAENIMHDISVTVLKMKGYRSKMSSAEESRSAMAKIFGAMRWGIDTLSMWILDAEDEIQEHSRNVAGIDKLLEHFIRAIVRATDMPRTILLGEQPGGINSNSDSEVRAWYDHVATQQEKVLTPAMNALLKVIFQIRANHGEVVPTQWTIEWEPLWQPTEKEKAQTGLVNAQAGQLQIASDTAASDEVRKKGVDAGEIVDLTETDPDPSSPIEPTGERSQQAAPSLGFAPTDLAAFVTVNQALASQGLPSWPDPEEGAMTVAEFRKLGEERGLAIGEAEGEAEAEEVGT